jgi:hypothetical protein
MPNSEFWAAALALLLPRYLTRGAQYPALDAEIRNLPEVASSRLAHPAGEPTDCSPCQR